jgi:phosphoribosylamine--glycine ligase
MSAPRARPLPSPCNVLLIGAGGREHALAWKLKQSRHLGKLWVTSEANAGMRELGEVAPEPMDGKDAFRMSRWCDRNNIHLIVIGPEGPLAAGMADKMQTEERMVFGPTRAAAQIEADKAFAKQLMRHAAVPTAEARVFQDADSALSYIEAHEDPCVVKATGLAAGKGVVVCETQDEARDAVDRMLVKREFGDAGKRILIEEKVGGQEVSILALVDGRTIWMLDACQDHKQIGEGDVGPNTGGMGAYSPTPLVGDDTLAQIEREIIVPTIDAMRREGHVYRGVLYAGLMLTPGGPKVLEFNCRFGDPECEVIVPRMQADLLKVLWATCTGTLDEMDITFDTRTACTVVMASAGYPGSHEKGKVITGIEEAEALAGDDQEVIVFHAGTARNVKGELVTNGGRVLAITALAKDLLIARDLANAACERIKFDGACFRRDIGHRVLNKPKQRTRAASASTR